ncbi:MAG: RnfH family protein [Burkholderiales bacterium]|nr:RnfH family protein [Burkholderiales bacterium]
MTLTVVVAYAAPDTEAIVQLRVEDGATVEDAVAASGLRERLALPAAIAYAIHGQAATAATPLAAGDRVEITRPLAVDAKAVRRARAAGHPLTRTRKAKR